MELHRMFLQVAIHGASDAETAIARKEGGLHRWDGLEKVKLGDVGRCCCFLRLLLGNA